MHLCNGGYPVHRKMMTSILGLYSMQVSSIPCPYPRSRQLHSSTLAWRIPCTEEPGRLGQWDNEEFDMTERLHFYFSLSCIGEGNGNPLQCSYLENPRDSGAWWAAGYRVTQSWTRLNRLSSSSSSSPYPTLFEQINRLPFILQCPEVKVLVVQSCLTLCNPRDFSRQVPLFMGFSRQEHWSR